ncbi:unnamed protein product [Agarophyton chilense]
MSDVQARLDLRTSATAVEIGPNKGLCADENHVETAQHDPNGTSNQDRGTHDDEGNRPFLAESIVEDEQPTGKSVTRLRTGGLLSEEARKEARFELQSTQELENANNYMAVASLSALGKQKPPTVDAKLFDEKTADLVHIETTPFKISNITKRISNAGSKASRIARKVSQRLNVGVMHIKKNIQAPKRLEKYYFQRYRLFHRFDEGVIMDDESWYSVTPEKIARHIAGRFAGRQLVVDLYSGAGGNSIQFALNGAYVIAVEISQSRIDIARNNARVYGVEEYIEFVAADVMDALKMMKERNMVADGIFLSPPWGGPGYQESESYDVGVFKAVVDLARMVSKDVSVLVPRNVCGDNVLKWFGPCELEWNYLGNKVKTVTIYFGDLIRCADGISERRGEEDIWAMT